LPRCILVADDERALRQLIARVLLDAGYEVADVADGAEAVDWLGRNRADLVLLDIKMPRLDGWGVLAHIAAMADRPRVVISTGQDEVVPPRHLVRYVAGILKKPYLGADVVGICRATLESSSIDAPIGRRREARRNFTVDATLLDEDGYAVSAGRLVQLSRGGFRVEGDLAVRQGEAIRIEFSLPWREKPARLVGRVAWRTAAAVGAEVDVPTTEQDPQLEDLIEG
jgi:two-component system, chemotaxis family, chemotaxis protein CheY